MPITIKSPNSDEIWEKWKQRAYSKQKKELEKAYEVKGASFSLQNITASEYVKNVIKAAVIYTEKRTSIKAGKTDKEKSEMVSWKKLDSGKYYEFNSQVDKESWKGPDNVPLFQTIEPVPCQKCGGRGYYEVTKKCNNCKDGNYYLKLDVFNEKNEKLKREFSIKCPECMGEKQFSEKERCKECGGTGAFYKYSMGAVPFKAVEKNEPVVFSSINSSSIEKELGIELQTALQNVEGITIDNPDKQLDEKFIEPNLGYYTKEIKNMIKDIEKELKNTKGSDSSYVLPFYLFPMIILDCITSKGKKFQVYSIGSSEKFIVLGNL